MSKSCGATWFVLLSSLVAVTGAGSAPAETRSSDWSEPASNLMGRIVAERPKIRSTERFKLTLELRNEGERPVVIQPGAPLAFTLRVLDANGKEVQPTTSRRDMVYSLLWAIVPKGTYLGSPATRDAAAPAGTTGAPTPQLDIGRGTWNLPAGTYTLKAEFSSDGFRLGPDTCTEVTVDLGGELGSRKQTVPVWQGRLVLPPITVEVEP